MKLKVLLVSVLYLLNEVIVQVIAQSPVVTKTMTLKVDHFNDNNQATWNMRYMVNEKYFKPGGPMFIYVGGELPINAPYIEWGLFVDLAVEHNGIMFYTEHRFYGESRVGDSLSMENLVFLNARQALADLAYFIRTQRDSDPRLTHSKVILTGCSYAGALTVWFNRLYPDLVDGTWAISAPIFATAYFPEYLEVTGRAISELGSPQCYDRIQRGIYALENMFHSSHAQEAAKILDLCDIFDYTKTEDIWTLFRAISHLFAQKVTYQKPEQEDIPKICDFLMKRPNDLTAVVDYFRKNFDSTDKNCKSLNYLGTVHYHNITSYDNIVSRAWMYQMCNEFGWFQGSISNQQPFGRAAPVKLDMQHCFDIFGPDFTEERIYKKIDETNRLFGGRYPNVKNVFMTYGSLDPWTPAGPGESPISAVVYGYSHCAHIDSIGYKDSPEMRASKEHLLVLVRQWLA